MRNIIPFLAIAALAAVFTSGCAGPEQKFGRGMSDSLEATRMGDLRRSVEQTTIFDSPSAGYTAPAHFTLTIQPMDGVAYTSGRGVTAARAA